MNEEYVHYQESLTSLNRAWQTICELESIEPKGAIWSAAYRMTLIEYCKPFKNSNANSKKLKIDGLIFDEEKDKLHKKILYLRDKVLAHSDIDILEAKIYYDKNAVHPIPLISTNIEPNMPKLSEIRKLIEFVLDELYKKQENYNSFFKIIKDKK